jgi:hypothetical protein
MEMSWGVREFSTDIVSPAANSYSHQHSQASVDHIRVYKATHLMMVIVD